MEKLNQPKNTTNQRKMIQNPQRGREKGGGVGDDRRRWMKQTKEKPLIHLFGWKVTCSQQPIQHTTVHTQQKETQQQQQQQPNDGKTKRFCVVAVGFVVVGA